ncbi:MAG: transposase, partial [Synergistaceae bacterium]|nr:transposase [Synergistaceae bacterium]
MVPFYVIKHSWPRIICADMIFRTRANHAWCGEKGIRLSGPRLGRPPKDEKKLAEIRRHEREDAGKRNEVEGE